MFTLEESALLGRMLRSLAVMGLCATAGTGYLLLRPAFHPALQPGAAEPARDGNGSPPAAAHHHRLRPHQTRAHERPKLNANSFIFRHIHG
jgi:hypothetical protein